MQEVCSHSAPVLVDGNKYLDQINYLTVIEHSGEIWGRDFNEDTWNNILNESLQESCLNYFKFYFKTNIQPVVLKKYITRKLSPSKAERIKKQLKNVDVVFHIKIRPSSIKILLYNTRYDLLAKYNNQNLKQEFSKEVFLDNLNNFYERYFFTTAIINQDNEISDTDDVVVNGRKIGQVKDFKTHQNELKIVAIPKNIKSYMQIESSTKNLISDKHYVKPQIFSLRKLNKKTIQNKRIEENKNAINLSYRQKIGAFKINLINQNRENINSNKPKVKLFDLLNLKGIETKIINNENNILVLTDQKYQKQWNYRAAVFHEKYPKTLTKKITLVDSSSYKLNINTPTEFMLTSYSKPKAYAYNLVFPGLGQMLAGDSKVNKAWTSYLPMTSYILFGFMSLKNVGDFNDYNDQSLSFLNLYNSGPLGQQGNIVNKNLSIEYYNKAEKAEKNIYLYTGATLIINALSNYYIRSKWFKWK